MINVFFSFLFGISVSITQTTSESFWRCPTSSCKRRACGWPTFARCTMSESVTRVTTLLTTDHCRSDASTTRPDWQCPPLNRETPIFVLFVVVVVESNTNIVVFLQITRARARKTAATNSTLEIRIDPTIFLTIH